MLLLKRLQGGNRWLLNEANTGEYENPEPSKVCCSIEPSPFIVISGHDLHDLKLFLEQTESREKHALVRRAGIARVVFAGGASGSIIVRAGTCTRLTNGLWA